MKKQYKIIGLIVVYIILLVSIAVALNAEKNKDHDATINKYRNVLKDDNVSIQLYKGIQCGCCTVYANYLQGRTKEKIDMQNVIDIEPILNQYNIPANMRSCHISIINGYVVVGHIPTEVINKLLTDKPDILGIAMPDMPSGSPGMPGPKYEDFVIYSLNKDGSITEFMRL
jgi:hypothetical protein